MVAPSEETAPIGTARTTSAVPAQDEAASTSEHGFAVAALREGPLELVRWDDRPILILDGEPVPIGEKGVPQRLPNAHAGLIPRYGLHSFGFGLVAYGEGPGGEAWVVTRQEQERAADVLDVYERSNDRWRRKTVEKTWLVEYYTAFISREETLLGLRAYAPSQRFFDHWEEAQEEPAEFLRTMERVRPGFVRLAGTKKGGVPRLPKGSRLRPFAAVTTGEGTVHAIAEPIRAEADPATDEPIVLLTWPPGEEEPRSSALPGLREYPSPTLTSLGEDVLVGGSDADGRPRILIGKADVFEPVPGLDVLPNGTVSSAAREPNGRLWLVIGERHFGGTTRSDALWTRSPEGQWSRVSLRAPATTPEDEGERWAWDADEAGWTRRERQPIQPDTEAAANRIVWARGDLWVVADFGELWAGGDAYGSMAIHRSVLYTTANVAKPVRLEPVDLNRVALLAAARPNAKPGEPGCRTFSVVLGTEARTLTSAELEAIEATGSLSGVVPLEIYVGEAGQKRDLVLGARSYDPKAARALIRTIGAAVGETVKIECGPRRLVEMIHDLGE